MAMVNTIIYLCVVPFQSSWIDYGAKHGGINRRRLCQDIQNGQILNIKKAKPMH